MKKLALPIVKIQNINSIGSVIFDFTNDMMVQPEFATMNHQGIILDIPIDVKRMLNET